MRGSADLQTSKNRYFQLKMFHMKGRIERYFFPVKSTSGLKRAASVKDSLTTMASPWFVEYSMRQKPFDYVRNISKAAS